MDLEFSRRLKKLYNDCLLRRACFSFTTDRIAFHLPTRVFVRRNDVSHYTRCFCFYHKKKKKINQGRWRSFASSSNSALIARRYLAIPTSSRLSSHRNCNSSSFAVIKITIHRFIKFYHPRGVVGWACGIASRPAFGNVSVKRPKIWSEERDNKVANSCHQK